MNGPPAEGSAPQPGPKRVRKPRKPPPAAPDQQSSAEVRDERKGPSDAQELAAERKARISEKNKQIKALEAANARLRQELDDARDKALDAEKRIGALGADLAQSKAVVTFSGILDGVAFCLLIVGPLLLTYPGSASGLSEPLRYGLIGAGLAVTAIGLLMKPLVAAYRARGQPRR